MNKDMLHLKWRLVKIKLHAFPHRILKSGLEWALEVEFQWVAASKGSPQEYSPAWQNRESSGGRVLPSKQKTWVQPPESV